MESDERYFILNHLRTVFFIQTVIHIAISHVLPIIRTNSPN